MSRLLSRACTTSILNLAMASFHPSGGVSPLQEGNDSSQSSFSHPLTQPRTSAHVLFSSSSVTDHPLLPPPPPPPPGPSSATSMDLELSERSSSAAPPRVPLPSSYYHVASSPSAPPSFAPPPESAPLFPPPPHIRAIPTAPSSDGAAAAPAAVPATLDDLADVFLSQQPEQGPSLSSHPIQAPLRKTPLLRPPPLGDFDNDLDKLRALAKRRAWADVVALANQLLRASSSHYASLYATVLLRPSSHPTPHTALTLESQQAELVEILSWQCQGLLKMRRYSELKHEVDQWVFCSHHVSPDQPLPISWIPWSLHILAATTLVHTASLISAAPSPSDEGTHAASTAAGPRTTDAADALWQIRVRIPSDDSASLIHVEQALSNVFLQRRQWRMALKCLQSALDRVPAAVLEHHQQLTAVEPPPPAAAVLEAAYRCELLSCQGRILLQVGALSEASETFRLAKVSWEDVKPSLMSPSFASLDLPWLVLTSTPVQLLVNDGLLSFAYSHFDQALEYFRKAIVQIRSLPRQAHPPATSHRREAAMPRESLRLLGVPTLEDLYSETCNNLSLCAVYTCRLPEAVHLMESLVREDPGSYLTDRVALNLWYVRTMMGRGSGAEIAVLESSFLSLAIFVAPFINSTLYELGSDTAASSRKKRVLQVIAKRFFLHDIGPESFRLG